MALAGAAVFGCEPPKKKLGLQLYTLRDVINNDVGGTMKKLVEWGYNEFEAYGYSDGNLFGMPAKEFYAYVKSLGAQVTSGHYGIDVLRGDWQKAVDDAKEAGQEYMILPYIDEPNRTVEGYNQIIADVNKAAEVTKAAGIRMGYHNHHFEFDKVGDGDKTGFEMLIEGLDPKLVSWELDLYWVVRAGQDPEALINKYPGRFEQWHVKDMDKTSSEKNADVGTGSIDFKKLFTLAGKSGLKHWYVEQESYPVDPMTSTKNSADYLKTI